MNPSSDSGCELGTGYCSVLIHKMAMIIPTTKSLFLGGGAVRGAPVALHSLWDLSSLTRDQTCALGRESEES